MESFLDVEVDSSGGSSDISIFRAASSAEPDSHSFKKRATYWDNGMDSDKFKGVPGKLLIRGKTPRNPYQRLEQINLPPEIIKGLNSFGCEDLSDLQKVACPTFMGGADMFIISDDGGKLYGRKARLLCYALPILALIYDKYKDKTYVEAQEFSPEAVIVVNSVNVGAEYETFFNNVLNFMPQLPMNAKFLRREISSKDYSSNPDAYMRRILPNGVAILIITMDFFKDTLETAIFSRKLSKGLKFLVIEEMDVFIKNMLVDIKSIIEVLKTPGLTDGRFKMIQFAFSGSQWYQEMDDLYSYMAQIQSPVVVIGSLNQAIRFARVNWTVHHVTERDGGRITEFDEKCRMVCELLTNFEPYHRIVITCFSNMLADDIYKHISYKFDFPIQLITSNMSHENIIFELNRWTKGHASVAIIADSMLTCFEVSTATCLIQFDTSSATGQRKSMAAERFRYLWSSIRQFGKEPKKAKAGEVNPPELCAHFLITGKEENFYPFYKFSHSLDTKLIFPEALKTLAKKMETQGTTDRFLCWGLRLFGFCDKPNPLMCPNRHFFTENDFKEDIHAPYQGEIEVLIVKCENPSQYRARLLRHYEFKDGTRVLKSCYEDDLKQRTKALNQYYNPAGTSSASNDPVDRPLLMNSSHKVEEASWCAVMDPEEGAFVRARLVEVVTKDKLLKAKQLRVYCVDKGCCLNPKADKVYQLPRKFQKWPSLVIHLILSNLKPPRDELEYRKSDEKKAMRLTTGKTFLAKIQMTIGNVTWVNPMIEYCSKSQRGSSLRMEYILQNCAASNKEHMDKIFELVKEHGDLYKGFETSDASSNTKVDVPNMRDLFHHLDDEVRWAFLEKGGGNESRAKIITIFGYDPWIFYGAIEKFQNELKQLEKDLSSCIEDYIAGRGDKSWINYTEIFKLIYEPGMIIAAKDDLDEKWVRGKIVSQWEEFDEDGQKKRTFKIFNVDYGDLQDVDIQNLFMIPKKFVSRMPFQAIALKLDNITPKEGRLEWSEEVKEAFLDTILPDNLSLELSVKVLDDVEIENEFVQNDIPVPCRYYKTLASVGLDDLGSRVVLNGLADRLYEPNNPVDNNNNENEEIDDLYLGEENDADQFEEWFASLGIIPRNGYVSPKPSDYTNMASENVPVPRTTEREEPRQNASLCPPEHDKNRAASALHSWSSSSRSTTEPVPGTSTNSDNLLRPFVLWHQTNSDLILTVELVDINSYTFTVQEDMRTIQFQTLDKPCDYGFTLTLFGKVSPKYDSQLTGLRLKLILHKKMDGVQWVRVLYDKSEKYRWLKQEFVEDQVMDEIGRPEYTWDDDYQVASVQKTGISSASMPNRVVDYSEDEESSDED